MRMKSDGGPNIGFEGKPEGTRKIESPRKIWRENVEGNVKAMG